MPMRSRRKLKRENLSKMIAQFSLVFMVTCIFQSRFGAGLSVPTCSGGCNCSRLASGEATASCNISNFRDLGRFIPRPQDIQILKLKLTANPAGDFAVAGANLSSLEVLEVRKNTSWTIPDEILKLPTLREIRVFVAEEACRECTLVRDYTDEATFASLTYIQNKGYKFRNVCTEHEFSLHTRYRSFAEYYFFPTCTLSDSNCQRQFGTSEARNRCLETGGPILIACIVIGFAAIVANLVVLVVILKADKLRRKPSMMLVCSLAVSDTIVASYAVALGCIYQLIDQENFQSRLDDVCPYLGFLAVSGLALTAFSSLLITTQRYLVVVHSMKHHLHMRVKSTMGCVAMTTAAALLLATWAYLTPRVFQGRETCIPVYGPETRMSFGFGLTNMIICALFYVLTFGLYAKIYITAKKSAENLGIRGRKALLLKKIGLIVVTNFVLGLSPFLIVSIGISVVSHGRHNYHEAWVVLGLYVPILCTSVNALVDPMIYAYRNAQFKRAVTQQWTNSRRRREQNIRNEKKKPSHDSPL